VSRSRGQTGGNRWRDCTEGCSRLTEEEQEGEDERNTLEGVLVRALRALVLHLLGVGFGVGLGDVESGVGHARLDDEELLVELAASADMYAHLEQFRRTSSAQVEGHASVSDLPSTR
jgi:hypothetical protein